MTQNPSPPFEPEDLIGTWHLKAHSLYPETFSGILLYLPDLSMSVIIQGQALIDNELRDHTIAYAGTFSIDGPFVCHQVEVSNLAKRLGTTQRRSITLKGRELILSETSDLNQGLRVVWERKGSTSPNKLRTAPYSWVAERRLLVDKGRQRGNL
ncbi:lipocalin-like domain-containing protein [Bdellovibrionota bacterium FG-2]